MLSIPVPVELGVMEFMFVICVLLCDCYISIVYPAHIYLYVLALSREAVKLRKSSPWQLGYVLYSIVASRYCWQCWFLCVCVAVVRHNGCVTAGLFLHFNVVTHVFDSVLVVSS